MFKKDTRSTKSTPLIKAFLLLLLVILACGALFGAFKLGERSALSTQEAADQDNSSIDFGPPSEADIVTDEEKEELVSDPNKDANDQQAPPEKKENTEVLVTDASQYDNQIEVRAFMPNVLEAGTCVITFTKAQDTVVKSLSARPDATTTICENLVIPSSELSPGQWTVKVEYTSENHIGVSDERPMEVS